MSACLSRDFGLLQALYLQCPLVDADYSATGSMDAVLKCGRFANVGNAAPNLKPHDSQYFGG